MLSFSLLELTYVWHSRRFIAINPYFKSNQFEDDLGSFFNNVNIYYTTYKDYDKKTDEEKLALFNEYEMQNMQSNYDDELRQKLDEVENKYNSQIDEAEKNKETERAARLLEERNKQLEEVRGKYTKTFEDIKKELIDRYNTDYNNIKSSLMSNGSIKYYIVNPNESEPYTNIKNLSDIESYLKYKALYSIEFPRNVSSQSRLSYVNSFFSSRGMKGYIIIPHETEVFTYVHSNYKYYYSMRKTIIFEFFIALLALAAGLYILKYLKKTCNESLDYANRLKFWYKKLPIDLKLLIFILYTCFILYVVTPGGSIIFGYGNSERVIYLTFGALYILFMIFFVPDAVYLIKNRTDITDQLKLSLILRSRDALMKSIKSKGLFFRIFIFIIAALIGAFGLFFLGLAIGNGHEDIVILFLLLYSLLLFLYVIMKLRYLNKIITATDEIAAGNINCTIKEKGKGIFSKLAHNINNLQEGIQKSVESQMKSDRLKSELITNVSHDLKTPLTSIINYVNLLKKEDLSREEIKDYISVLDRKTQRLKILIEDLFEASKMASGSVELSIEKVDAAQLLNQALAEFDEKIKNSNLSFKVNIPHSKVIANLDGKKVWRVFENLIGNIIKYSQPNTRVYINLYETENKVTITMKNISAYELDFDVEEIFERFKRGDASRNTEGSGLGLAIAKSIVDLHNGRLNIETDGDLFKATVEFNK
jgi:signal transduction histidine kinase